jgi:hypothetical protein
VARVAESAAAPNSIAATVARSKGFYCPLTTAH